MSVRAATSASSLAGSAVLLCLARIAAIAALSAAAWWVIGAIGLTSTFPPSALVSCVVLIPVNVGTLLVARRMLHRRGRTVRALLGFDRSRVLRDVGWGLVWLMVLYLPFVATIVGVMALIYGRDAFSRFATVFVPEAYPEFSLVAAVILGVVAVMTFAPLNAPAEEIAYRGLAQSGLAASRGAIVALLVPAALFGLQHLFFAPSPTAMVVYGAAFFVWGLGSGLIYRWQQRLAPLVVSHGVVNLMSTLPTLVVPLVV